ncbi:hypothetical protein JZ751_016374 [Albula glossodonta]|uniref:Uncharacterized protein n=1 Tax=Albula glossodonta TaxID=121402 RepID=A0A8T2NQ61_9TELE|nr:hypothetical protein JZ751_016374 [Albula glossodonta]
MEEGRTEPLLIKEERLEEDSDPLGELKFEEERTLGLRPGGGERPPIQEVQNKAANHTEELSEQQRTRHGVWESADQEEGRTKPLHVKEERLKETMENHSPQRELRNREDSKLRWYLC